MRQENLPRLSGIKLKSKSQHYIHLFFLLKDIKYCIETYSKGYLLDLGCGNKPYAQWYSKFSTASIGCDILQSNENKVDVLCPATELAFKSDLFDTVLCTQVLEHVYDHHALVKEANRVLKKGGTLILSVPFCWELHEEPYDFFRLTKHGLKELFDENNFTIVSINSNGGKWAASIQMMINTVFSTFRHKTLRAKFLKIIFIELRLCQLLNKLAIWADQKYFDDIWTLNYTIVGTKKL